MRLKIFLLAVCCQMTALLHAQDTFSILAFDSITGEVGAAGASCVDLFQFSGYTNDFIAELFPGAGAVVTQAAHINPNQVAARMKFNQGYSPTQLMNYMIANDAQGNPSIRQYGVVRLDTMYPRAAAFTGSNCMTYKNHIVGPNYSIQGNILLGQKVLDSMEVRYNRETGDLACKLMAAMQGAKMVGADSRCAGNGSSSLFAFIKTSLPTDTFGYPFFSISLKTHANAGIEPIDSLQAMFSSVKSCTVNTSSIYSNSLNNNNPLLYPNPASHKLMIKTGNSLLSTHCVIRDLLGETLFETGFISEVSISTAGWDRGVIFVELRTGSDKPVTKKVILD